jgi:hypothetical protein
MNSDVPHPREEPFAAPPRGAENTGRPWTLVAYNHRVNECWQAFIECEPTSAARWYSYLLMQAMTRYPHRVFPLRGSEYAGAWECEISRGDRLYYIPDENTHKVVVYYVGPHPKRAPKPP